jgi:hypothetical protein
MSVLNVTAPTSVFSLAAIAFIYPPSFLAEWEYHACPPRPVSGIPIPIASAFEARHIYAVVVFLGSGLGDKVLVESNHIILEVVL